MNVYKKRCGHSITLCVSALRTTLNMDSLEVVQFSPCINQPWQPQVSWENIDTESYLSHSALSHFFRHPTHPHKMLPFQAKT